MLNMASRQLCPVRLPVVADFVWEKVRSRALFVCVAVSALQFAYVRILIMDSPTCDEAIRFIDNIPNSKETDAVGLAITIIEWLFLVVASFANTQYVSPRWMLPAAALALVRLAMELATQAAPCTELLRRDAVDGGISVPYFDAEEEMDTSSPAAAVLFVNIVQLISALLSAVLFVRVGWRSYRSHADAADGAVKAETSSDGSQRSALLPEQSAFSSDAPGASGSASESLTSWLFAVFRKAPLRLHIAVFTSLLSIGLVTVYLLRPLLGAINALTELLQEVEANGSAIPTDDDGSGSGAFIAFLEENVNMLLQAVNSLSIGLVTGTVLSDAVIVSACFMSLVRWTQDERAREACQGNGNPHGLLPTSSTAPSNLRPAAVGIGSDDGGCYQNPSGDGAIALPFMSADPSYHASTSGTSHDAGADVNATPSSGWFTSFSPLILGQGLQSFMQSRQRRAGLTSDGLPDPTGPFKFTAVFNYLVLYIATAFFVHIGCMLLFSVAVFIVAFPPARKWLVDVLIGIGVSMLLNTVVLFILERCVTEPGGQLHPEQLKRPRLFLLLDFVYSVTVGAAVGVSQALVRIFVIMVWSMVAATQLDRPMYPHGLRDPGFSAHGSMVKLQHLALHQQPPPLGQWMRGYEASAGTSAMV